MQQLVSLSSQFYFTLFYIWPSFYEPPVSKCSSAFFTLDNPQPSPPTSLNSSPFGPSPPRFYSMQARPLNIQDPISDVEWPPSIWISIYSDGAVYTYQSIYLPIYLSIYLSIHNTLSAPAPPLPRAMCPSTFQHISSHSRERKSGGGHIRKNNRNFALIAQMSRG